MTVGAERVARNFIGGAWVDPQSSRFASDLDPSNQEVIARIPQSDASDVDATVAEGPKEMGAAVEFFTRSKTVYVEWS